MRFFLVGLILIVLSSCLSDPDCIVSASNSVKLVFTQVSTNTPKYVVYPVIISSGTDQITVADSVTKIFLYVDPRATQTTIKFQKKDGHPDSVTLQYKIQNIVISPDCGAYAYYSDLHVVAYSFSDSDTVWVTNSNLSNDSTVQNVEIRY